VLDHIQENVLGQILQVDRWHALAIEPADDQGTIEVRQILPRIRFAGLSAEKQALSGLIHNAILPAQRRRRFTLSNISRPIRLRFSAAGCFLFSSVIV
jgi:hypothetical protein